MPTFVYQGRNSEGQAVNGKRLAQSADALGAQLLKEGVLPIRIDAEQVNASGWAQLKKIVFRKKLTTDDLAIFYPHPELRFPASEQWPTAGTQVRLSTRSILGRRRARRDTRSPLAGFVGMVSPWHWSA